jgi:hypothetical protein
MRALTGIVMAAALMLPAAAQAATFHVTDTSDPGLGALCITRDNCTLRGAIDASNADGGSNTILVDPGTYVLSGNVELPITTETTIERAGATGTVTIDGNNGSRVLDIDTSVSGATPTTLRNLTITGGLADTGGGIRAATDLVVDGVTVKGNTASGAVSGTAKGGGLHVMASLQSTGPLVVTDNLAHGTGTLAEGGGIFADAGASVDLTGLVLDDNQALSDIAALGGGMSATSGAIVLDHATIAGNDATVPGGTGGAIGGGLSVRSNAAMAIVLLDDSRITGNRAHAGNLVQGAGAQIELGAPSGRITVYGSTIDGNVAQADGSAANAYGGGALLGSGVTSVINSTITGNIVTQAQTGSLQTQGGALGLDGGPATATIFGTTISGNTSEDRDGNAAGGAIYSGQDVTLNGSIVSGNTSSSGSECSGAGQWISSGGNVVPTSPTCLATILGTDVRSDAPGLSALANNGGPTPTMLLSSTSPALDRYAPGCATTVDQRGVTRPQGALCDAGAVEMRASDFPVNPPAPSGGGGGTIPVCRDLDLTTPAGTPATVRLRCSPGVWNWAVAVQPEHGKLSAIDDKGELTYTPDPGFSGDDRFRYSAQGGLGRSNAALAVIHVTGTTPAPTPTPAPKPTPRTCTATVRLNPKGTRFVRVRVSGAPAKVKRSGQTWRATVTVSDGHATLHVNGRRPDGGLTKRTLSVTC